LSEIDIVPVKSRRALNEFVGFPYRLHRGDPQWIPQLRVEVKKLLSPKKNPFFEHAEAQYFLARRAGKTVGRIAAFSNRRHNETFDDRVGFFGFFECVDDPETARALFDEAAAWLRSRDLNVLRGPISFTMSTDEVGLLVDGFDTPPAIMTPHNPRYYVRLVEGAGFDKAKDLVSYQSTEAHLDFNGPLIQRLRQGAALLEKRYGLTTRSVDFSRFDAEVALIKELYNKAWESNWGFVPLTEREIDHIAAQLKPIADPDILPFVLKDGKPIGFAVVIPDLNVALKSNPSGRLFPGILKILRAARRISRVRIMLLGTLPEWRRKGIDALLYRHIWDKGYPKGYHWGEAGWILEDNGSMNNALLKMGFEPYKRYRIFERPIRSR
jgi:GNAT superfamily N-acetyltransferase